MEAKDVRPLMEALASVYEGYGKKKKGDCVSKSEKGEHNCAKKVCHEQYGEGECIFGQHAVPDENGFVSHYDVQFEHGVVENVSVEELEIITEGSHNEENHRYEGETISEMDERSPEYNRKKQEEAKKAHHNKKKQTPITAGGGAPEESGQVDRYRQMARERARKNQNNMESADLFDLVKGYLLDEGHADTEEDAMYIMANMTEESRTEILDFIESMASASRMKEIKEKGFERPARSREFEKRLPSGNGGSRGPEFEHGSTRSSDTPSKNLSANRGRGSRGPEFRHGSGEGPYDTRGTAIKNPENLSRNTGRYPRDKKGNLMY